MSPINSIDNLRILLDQSKAIIAISGAHDSLDTLGPEVLNGLFSLFSTQLSEMDKCVSALSVALLSDESGVTSSLGPDSSGLLQSETSDLLPKV